MFLTQCAAWWAIYALNYTLVSSPYRVAIGLYMGIKQHGLKDGKLYFQQKMSKIIAWKDLHSILLFQPAYLSVLP